VGGICFARQRPPGPGQRRSLSWAAATAGPAATGAAKPTARLGFGTYPPPVLGDPRLRVGFGGEWADLGRMPFGDIDLHCERPVLNRDHPIGRLGVGMRPLCHWLDLSPECRQKLTVVQVALGVLLPVLPCAIILAPSSCWASATTSPMPSIAPAKSSSACR